MNSLIRETTELLNSSQTHFNLGSHGINVDRLTPPSQRLEQIIHRAFNTNAIDRDDALFLVNLEPNDIPYLLHAASSIRDRGKGRTITYSKNVFVPLTRLCRDHCGYCTFKIEPGEGELFLPPGEVLDMARKGAALGCTELLFVTGDKPELSYPTYVEALGEIGYKTTSEYLIDMCEAVMSEDIFPHSNLGLANMQELSALRRTNPSMGLMLENISPRLLKKGEAHHRCADKVPTLRMKTMELAGELRIAWTSGILVGIGETWEERIDSLLALKSLSDKYGHIQEIIVQNFIPKHGIPMEKYPQASFIDMLKTVAISRLVFGEGMNIQIPPNLNPETYSLFVFAGINDLGGVSPITIDYVNPECPWPQIGIMRELSSDLGFSLKERLPVYPEFISDEFIDKNLLDRLNKFIDNRGYVVPKEDNDAIN